MFCQKCDKEISAFSKEENGVSAVCSSCFHTWLLPPIEASLYDIFLTLEKITMSLQDLAESQAR